MEGFRVVHTEGKNNGLLKEQRVVKGLTQQQVADKAGILIKHYQKFEGGERNLRTASFDVACRVLEALDLDIVKYFHHEYALGEERYMDSEGWKYKKTGKPVDEDVE
jgi:transcriptional regulator with XRE-family HTH domain